MRNEPGLPNLELFPFFQGLPDSLLESWKPKLKRKRFAKRQPLHFPVSCPDVIYFVCSGKVKISYYSEDGKEFTVAILAAGQVYSEHSLALATALEETEVLYLSMEDFGCMMDESPELARRLIRVLGQILRMTNDLIVDLAFREAAPRLARVFLRAVQADKNQLTLARPESQESVRHTPALSAHYSVQLTHEELAALSGTTRQTVNEILRHWERQGILSLQRGQVVILSFERLREKLNA